jgi:hypothetical protein
MKRNTVIAIVLCLMMITTAGASGTSAKQENPRQAGNSSIYFYDVEVPDGIGYGRLVIDTAKKTFTFIGQDFPHGQHIRIKVDTESEDHLIAEGKSTKSGNLHIKGEWEGTLPKPGTVSASYIWGPAYGFSLENLGGYVAHIKVQWSTDDGVTWQTTSNQSKDVSLFETYDQNIKDLDPNIPIGSLVKMKMDVVWGDDVFTSEIFKYVDTPGLCWPYFESAGAVWNAYVGYRWDDCYIPEADLWCIFYYGCTFIY